MNARFMHQVKFLIVFYIFASFMDWAAYAGGKAMFHSGDITCTEKDFLVIETNGGAGYMLYYSSLSFFYAISMWYIFF